MGGGGEGAAAAEGGSASRELDQTPTWAVASVCAVIILISILLEKALHHIGEVMNLICMSFWFFWLISSMCWFMFVLLWDSIVGIFCALMLILVFGEGCLGGNVWDYIELCLSKYLRFKSGKLLLWCWMKMCETNFVFFFIFSLSISTYFLEIWFMADLSILQWFTKRRKKPLFEALEKVKAGEE